MVFQLGVQVVDEVMRPLLLLLIQLFRHHFLLQQLFFRQRVAGKLAVHPCGIEQFLAELVSTVDVHLDFAGLLVPQLDLVLRQPPRG